MAGAANLTNAGKGRKKGAVNKTTRIAKEAIAFAADELGGGERLAQWAAEAPENERAFWSTIYPKLLPLQVEGAGKDGAHLHEVAWRVISATK